MFFSPQSIRFVARTLSLALVWCGLQSSVTHAAFVTTAALAPAAITSPVDSRAEISQVLARADVRAQLLAYGVNPAAVDARIAALTDDEAKQLAKQMADLPAGGDGLGVVILVLLVLVVTDLLGLTDVFPAIRPAI